MKTFWRGLKVIVLGLLFITPILGAVLGADWVIFRGPMWSKWALLIVGGTVFVGLASYGLGWLLDREDEL